MNIINWCIENRNLPPTWSEQAGSVFVTFMPAVSETRQVTPQAPDKFPTSVTPQEAAVLQAAEKPASRAELQKSSELRDREHFMDSCLKPLLDAALLEMTIPDKPRSSKQKYRLTMKGRQFLATVEGGGK